MSINQVGINYNNYDYRTKAIGNTPAVNSMSLSNNPFDLDTFQLSSKETVQQSSSTDIAELKKDLQETKSKQGLIGKIWDGFKNLTGIGAGSNKAEKAIEDFEKGKISEEEMLKKVNGYKEGQKTCVDVVADVASGILAVGAFALAVPTGGASLAVGLGLATAVGVGVKVGVKASDALLNDREYTGKDLLYDTATGAINGLLAPLTNGLGNTVTKTIGKKLGLKVVQEGAEEVAEQAVKQGFKQGLKSAVLNQSTDVVGGSLAKRAVSLGAGMAVDGALGGAGDNMVRAALNGENIIKAGIQGAVGGLIMAPIIGGGFRVAGKAGRALNGKITMSKVLPDGISTKFKQGSVGDCALLSTIDGMMNNPTTAKALKKSITKTIGGDYNVKIGDKIVKVAKSSLTDEMLSDTTGIKIFEQAYKQINGSLDGGFAEVVAKQFGLNPVHIVNESITDELLDTLAKNQGDTVLSFGALVDTNGSISNVNGQPHYFTIKNIDPDTKMVKLTSPTDTSQVIELSYEQVRNMGISIDGGTTKNIDLPTSARNLDDEMFKGIQYVYDVEDEFILTPFDYQNPPKIQNFSGDKFLLVGDKEIPLGKYRKVFKQLKGDPNASEIFDFAGIQMQVYGDGKVISFADSDLPIKICTKNEVYKLDDISFSRKNNLIPVQENVVIPKEKILSFFSDDIQVDSSTYFKLKNLSDEDLLTFYNCYEPSNSVIEAYKGDKDTFLQIQSALDKYAEGIEPPRAVATKIDKLSGSIEKHVVPNGTNLYRGTGYGEFGELGIKMEQIDLILDPVQKELEIKKFLLANNQQQLLTYNRFMSTNIGDFAENFNGTPILMYLKTVNDSRGISIVDTRYSQKELEILLQRGAEIKYFLDYDFDKAKWILFGTVAS